MTVTGIIWEFSDVLINVKFLNFQEKVTEVSHKMLLVTSIEKKRR